MSLQAAFEARLTDIVKLAASHFRGLGPEAKEEAIQNTVGLCWKYMLRLEAQGKANDEAVFKSMVWYAIRHTRQGRLASGQGGGKPKDVFDYARRGKAGVAMETVDLGYFVSKSASVPDAVAFRIDTENFLDTLSERNRALAMDLASGLTTSDAAKEYGVTAGAISQFRTRFKRWYEAFHAEA